MPDETPALVIRVASPPDAAALATLISEQDLHYWNTDPFAGRDGEGIVAQWLRRENCDGRFAIAEREGGAVGFAHFAVFRPGVGLSGVLFVKDLFVSERARSGGVGAAMMAWLGRLCEAEGYGRLDLTAEDHNPRARSFYASLGSSERDEKIYIRWDGSRLTQLAQSD